MQAATDDGSGTSPAGSLSVTAVVSDFPATSQTFVLRKLLGLSAAGARVVVASSRFTPDAAGTGLELLPLLPWSDLRHPRRAGRAWRSVAEETWAHKGGGRKELTAAAALAPLLAADTDLVHFEFSGIAVTYRSILDRLRPARLVVSCRGAAEQIVPLEDPTRIPLLQEVFDRVDLIHCVSDDIRSTVIDLGADGSKIMVNRPAVPVADFAPLAAARGTREPDDTLRVLSIGRLHWKKGLDDGIRAVAGVRDSGHSVEYRIVGEGPERSKLTFMVDELDLHRQVRMLGARTVAEVRSELAWADVLLLPSWSEGISNAVLEAMASGLPVIVTRCGGMAEVIDDGVDGLLVDVGDIDAMAERLRVLATDPDLRRRLGAAAAARAELQFDLSRQVGVFMDAYRSLLTSGGGISQS